MPPHPTFGTPLPLGGRGDGGEGAVSQPTACAVGYSLSALRASAHAKTAGSADPRFWGPRFFRGTMDNPRTPTTGVRATKPRGWRIHRLVCLRPVSPT
ncbi:hypothetical protein SBA2_840002 [Acidobacteriia bacterium SbA2]|nr:hypothetical protein SBA2_840002 [Acidobacteriia bacterium SbA2]